jgi:hypothetical protein
VDRHLAGCAACRDTLSDFERLAAALAATPVPAPPGDWADWHAGLSRRLARRTAERPAASGWRLLPVPVLAAALVAGLVYLGLPHGPRTGPGDLALLEDALLASRLDLIARLEVIQRLELLEDLDVIRRLDTLPSRGEG